MGRREPAERWCRVRVRGAGLTYLEVGAGDPVLFLHGWGLTPRTYAPSIRRICRAGVRVIAPALPGFGGSAPLPLRAGLRDYAGRVASLVERVSPDQPPFVMGHSFGGGVGIALATDRPDLVRSLTLLNSVGGSPGKPSLGRGRPGEGMTSRPWWEWALAATAEADPRTLLGVPPWTLASVGLGVVRDLVPNLLRHPLAMGSSALLALGADLAAQAQALVDSGMPVLFVWGDRDRLMAPGAFTKIVSSLPAEVVQGRHGWLLTEPDAFAHLLHNALVVHAMLERAKRGEALTAPAGESLAGFLPDERRHRARHPHPVPEPT